MVSVKNYVNNEIEKTEKTIMENENDIVIDGKITYKTIGKVLLDIHMAELDFAQDPKKNTINVFINCNDCDFVSAISIYSVLEASNLKVNTFIYDKALGMSLLIFLVGDNRYMTKDSYIKIRDPHILKCYEKYDDYFKLTEDNNEELLLDVEILTNILRYKTFLGDEKIDKYLFSNKITNNTAMKDMIATGIFRWIK